MNKKDLELLFNFFTEVGIINQLSNAILEKDLPLGLKPSQFHVLNHFLRTGDGETHAELAANMQVTKGAMTNTLNRLKTHGLIRIETDSKDGRVKRTYITQKGREVHKESIQLLYCDMLALQNEIEIDKFKQTIPFLMHVRKVLDKTR